jgi:hypothetical protein
MGNWWDNTQKGDIALTVNQDLLGDGIRFGETLHYYNETHGIFTGVYEAFKNALNPRVPVHSLMIKDPVAGTGWQMNPPHPDECSLSQWSLDPKSAHVVAVFRSPWLREGVLPDDERETILGNIDKYWNRIIGIKEGYGYQDVFKFILPFLPLDKKHLVCSMVTEQCWFECFDLQGYEMNCPQEWFVNDKVRVTDVNIISTYDHYQVYSANGFGVQLI